MAMVLVRGAQRGLSLPAAAYKPLDSAQAKNNDEMPQRRVQGDAYWLWA